MVIFACACSIHNWLLMAVIMVENDGVQTERLGPNTGVAFQKELRDLSTLSLMDVSLDPWLWMGPRI